MIRPCNQSFSSPAVTKEGCGRDVASCQVLLTSLQETHARQSPQAPHGM